MTRRTRPLRPRMLPPPTRVALGRPRRPRGFSIAELMLVLIIATLVIAVTIPMLRQPKTQTETHAMAMTIAEEMRLAHSRAIGLHIPVAVVFPSQDGTLPCAQSYYVLEGEGTPRITRVVDLARQYPSACIFNGFWDLDPVKLSDPARTNTITPPPTGASQSDFAMRGWGGTGSDFAFVFMPSGAVQTNGLVNFDGQYHVVTTQGATYEPGTVASNDTGFVEGFSSVSSFFKLTGASQPYTVNLSPLGVVTVSSGVTGSAGSLNLGTGAPIPLPSAAPPPVVPPPSYTSPTIVVGTPVDDLKPAANPDTLPPAVDATLDPGGTLSWTVHATDSDGNPLYCTWSVAAVVPGTPPGALSRSDMQRMDWNDTLGEWVATVLWQPPPTAAPGTKYVLTASVTDQVAPPTVVTRTVQVVGYRMVFTSERNPGLPPGQYQIYATNADGTGRTRLTGGADTGGGYVQLAVASPDGKRIAYGVEFATPASLNGVWIMNADGSQKQQLTTGPMDAPDCFSPDGRQIVIHMGLSTLMLINGVGAPVRTIAGGVSVYRATFSPDGKRIAYESPAASPSDIVVQDLTTGTVQNLTQNASSGVWHDTPAFSPDGSRIAFCAGAAPSWNVFVMDSTNGNPAANPGGQNLVQLTSTTGVGNPGLTTAWLADGSRILYIKDGNVIAVDPTNTDLVGNPTGQNPLTLVSDGATYDAWFSR